jgi:hypothetical protein
MEELRDIERGLRELAREREEAHVAAVMGDPGPREIR